MSDIVTAASALLLNPQPSPDRARPPAWWTRTGYIVAERKGGKIETLKSISKEITKNRQPKGR